MNRSTVVLMLGLLGATVVALLGLVPESVRAQSKVAAPVVHGLAPLPGGRSVPQKDRPPGATPGDGGPSPVIFPVQELSIRFNHSLHVRELGLACTACHRRATTSQLSSDLLFPEATACDKCHETNHTDLSGVRNSERELISQCGFCHIGYRPEAPQRVVRQSVPAPNLRFSHRVHAERNIGCQQCHGEVQNIELATRDQLPRMKGCFNCHQMPHPARGEAPNECTACHLAGRDGRMRNSFSEGTLKPPNWLFNAAHDAGFLDRHKFVAGNNSEFCSSCHSERFCTDCHDGRVRPRNVHPNDFLSMHAIAARQNDPNCSSCHRAQSFCLGCHQRVGVTLSGPAQNLAGRGRFHPPKAVWTDGARTTRHHAFEAQRNLSTCVSCHSEQDCLICHATRERGGAGVGSVAGASMGAGPHPPGFANRCRGVMRRNPRACLACHHPQDAKLRQCR